MTRALRRVLAAEAAAILVLAVAATATTTHTYPVQITIVAKSGPKRIEGDLYSTAPSEFCTSSTVRILHPQRGKDEVVARVQPIYSHWSFKIKPKRSGERLYAQTLKYHLPSRPVVCEAGRSRAVTAP